MNRITRVFLSVFLAVLTTALFPAQVFADTPDYISEVKVGIGSAAELEKDGFTVLKNEKGKAIDLNTDAGGGYGSKGDKAVYLGYKTTKEKKDAITDLALMNMKGGYSVQEYEALMEMQMKSQIIPFVDGFLAAIEEYRANYRSDNAANQQRAQYIHDILNKMKDDDCGGAGLGDLLLNETVYEMAKTRYDALSAEQKQNTTIFNVNEQVRGALTGAEKNRHADILTIIAQSNGKATLMLENLLTRAADTDDENWLDRFAGTTYADLESLMDGTPTDKRKALTKRYDDKANDLLDRWEDFRTFLLDYDEAAQRVEKYDDSAYTAAAEAMAAVTEATGAEEAQRIAERFAQAEADLMGIRSDVQCIAIHDALEAYDYLDGTLLDFFTMESEEIEDDITLLYPLVASLSAGQLAGMEFVSMKEMMAIAMTDETGYSDAELDNIAELSVYDGVDRGIYRKGGVALTSDALRADALLRQTDEEGKLFSDWSIAMMAITGATFLALVGSGVAWAINVPKLSALTKTVNNELNYYQMAYDYPFGLEGGGKWSLKDVYKNNPEWETQMKSLTANTSLCKGLTIGLGVAMIALTAVTTYLAWKDMHDYYKVDFTPIPHYMVDGKDLISYNKKGEKIVLKNQSAYYKAVESTMKQGDFKFDEIGNLADLNGCVGKQWLALYAAKNELEEPILAGSLLVVVDSPNIPAGYQTGIHMFGENAAFNLNNSHFDWNDDADSVYVYFQRDDAAASTLGSAFSGGTLALGVAAGLALGVLGTVLFGTFNKKRKAKATA